MNVSPRYSKEAKAPGRALIAALLFLTSTPCAVGAQEISIINMIPKRLAKEVSQNSEPYLTVGRDNAGRAAASSYVSGSTYCGRKHRRRTPLYVSLFPTTSWSALCLLPKGGPNELSNTTVQLAQAKSPLYASALTLPVVGGVTQQHATAFAHPGPYQLVYGFIAYQVWLYYSTTTIYARDKTDQPYLRAAQVAGSTSVSMGATDKAMDSDPTECTTYLGQGIVAIADPPSTVQVDCLGRTRQSAGFMPTVRLAAQSDGTTYALYYRPVGTGLDVDVVVSRRDPGLNSFTALNDDPATTAGGTPVGTGTADCSARDGLPGMRVVRCATYPDPSVTPAEFGQQREYETELSVAVSPGTSPKVFIAWAEKSPTNPAHLALHFGVSTDRGKTWTVTPLTIDHATSPALAVASDGAVGVLYQQLDGSGADARWHSRLAISTDDLGTLSFDALLANVRANSPAAVVQPYLGDWVQLEAVGRNFYGVFSASNDLTTGTFLNLANQRPYAGGLPADSFGNPVPISIDPYFFRVIRD